MVQWSLLFINRVDGAAWVRIWVLVSCWLWGSYDISIYIQTAMFKNASKLRTSTRTFWIIYLYPRRRNKRCKSIDDKLQVLRGETVLVGSSWGHHQSRLNAKAAFYHLSICGAHMLLFHSRSFFSLQQYADFQLLWSTEVEFDSRACLFAPGGGFRSSQGVGQQEASLLIPLWSFAGQVWNNFQMPALELGRLQWWLADTKI